MGLETKALLNSLRAAPLLVGDLAEAAILDRLLLGEVVSEGIELNFQQKLGHLYEDALECLLDASEQLDRIASHVQVVDDAGVTLGELDFVLYDRQQQMHVHLELAVKFYLATHTPEGWMYPGPDPRDNWQRKLDRMRTHQLLLSQQPEARRLLKDRFNVDTVVVCQLIYGRLFSPLSGDDCPLPEAIAPSAQRGQWLYVRAWESWFSGVDEVCLVPKALWPVVFTAELKAELQRIEASELLSLATERCTMFVLPDSDEPFFLVPDDWQEH
ncbi:MULTISPECIES: DUF1853 family protein [unclassified Lentimonas]|uniref:DUF1853 family protein n=1 Tax=unclassified Lentimonas TaxID=2630993 RepID=UPI0013238703|nr:MULTISPECIES: DUF1853 family protein [unclassified Lentimonas]CAA6689638.1 Unannotated [Lentimonas sp. CC19]CAA6692629.1 Unannotated [Lentimonas sp. CC10]CAA7069228.1 Unannotated [Lentimonas sp. CC11]